MSNSEDIQASLVWLKENSESIYNSNLCGYVFTLLNGSIVKVNAVVSEWTGLSKDHLLSDIKFRDLLTVGNKIYFETNCFPLLKMQGYLNEIALDINGPDGSTTPILLNSEVIRKPDNTIYLYRHTLFPVNDRQKYERELLHERKKSEKIVEELREEKSLRERFVETLTHDLRTPNAAAKMSAQLLERKAEDVKMVHHLAQRITKNMDRSDHMIKDLLDANRIKGGEGIPLEKKHCNFQTLARDSIADLEQLFGQRFELIVNAEIIIGVCDTEALGRVIENLASNAIKYGSPGKMVTITLTNPDPQSIGISVHNDGNIISEADQKTLFSRYRRTESASSSGVKGWGIGLTLVKGITEAHGGKVSVTSSIHSGTVFLVEFPII